MARLVSKQYVEDVDEDAGLDYRYWELVIDVDGEEFGVREAAIARKLAREGRAAGA